MSSQQWECETKKVKKTNSIIYEVDKYKVNYCVAIEASFLIEQYGCCDKVALYLRVIIFDIGAYVGKDALRFSCKVTPNGVYAFVPDKVPLKRLMTQL